MKVQFDQNGFRAQMNSSNPDADSIKKGLSSAKNHTALIFGILALAIVLALFPYVMFLDVSADIVDLFATEGFQSTQEIDETLWELGFPFSPGDAIYTFLSTVNLHRFMAFLAVFGFIAIIVDMTFAILAIVSFAQKASSRTATAGFVLAIVSLVACIFLAIVGVACLV